LREAGLGDLLFDIGWLAAFAILGLILAAMSFRKRLD